MFSSIIVDKVREMDAQEVLSVLVSRTGEVSTETECWRPVMSAIIQKDSSIHRMNRGSQSLYPPLQRLPKGCD